MSVNEFFKALVDKHNATVSGAPYISRDNVSSFLHVNLCTTAPRGELETLAAKLSRDALSTRGAYVAVNHYMRRGVVTLRLSTVKRNEQLLRSAYFYLKTKSQQRKKP